MTQEHEPSQSMDCAQLNMNGQYAAQVQGQCQSRNSNSNQSEIGKQAEGASTTVPPVHAINQQQQQNYQIRNRQQLIKQQQLSGCQIPESFQQIPLNAYIQGKAHHIIQPQSVACAEEYLHQRNQYAKYIQHQWALQQEQVHQQEQSQLQKYCNLENLVQCDQFKEGSREECVRLQENQKDVQKMQQVLSQEQQIGNNSHNSLRQQQEVNAVAKDANSNTSRNVSQNLHVWNFLNNVSTTQSAEADNQSINSNNKNNTSNNRQQNTDPPSAPITSQTILQNYEKEIKFLKQLHFCINEQLQKVLTLSSEAEKKRSFDIIFCCLRLVEEQQVGVVGLFESQIGNVVQKISKMESFGGVSAELARILEDKWIDTVEAWIHSDYFAEEIEFIVQRSQSGWLGLIEEWRRRRAEFGIGVEMQNSEEGSNHATNCSYSPNNYKKQEEATQPIPSTCNADFMYQYSLDLPQSQKLPWNLHANQQLGIERLGGMEKNEERSCNGSVLEEYQMEDIEDEVEDSGDDEDYVASEMNDDTLDTQVNTQEQSDSETEVLASAEKEELQ